MNAFSLDLQVPETSTDHLSVIPISVIDIGAQGKRQKQDHNAVSSRSEYSPFPEEIATLCSEFFLKDATIVFDPFAGWGERGAAVVKQGKKYIGFDVSQKAIANAFDKYQVQNILADSSLAEIPIFDGLLTCPPYWNLEKYESEVGIDRCRTFYEFIASLNYIFARSYKAAKSNSTFCIMVGDWRKNHVYYDLEWQVCNMFKNFGATVVDKIVVSRSKVSKIKIMLPQAKRLGYSVRVHENLLVFKKP